MARLEPFYPKPYGKPRIDDRRVLSENIFIITMAYGGSMPLPTMVHTVKKGRRPFRAA